ncbi:MAG: hypothetical protein ACHQF3_01265 [Alphaproteobacteria bacterium]
MSIEYLEEMRRIAKALQEEETAFRQESAKRAAVLADRRARAYRRYHMLREMIELATPLPDQAACVEAQTCRVLAEAGWSDADAAYGEVSAALGRVALQVHADLHGATGEARGEESSAPKALDAFELWYRQRFGSDFPALHPEEAPSFQSLVDF